MGVRVRTFKFAGRDLALVRFITPLVTVQKPYWVNGNAVGFVVARDGRNTIQIEA